MTASRWRPTAAKASAIGYFDRHFKGLTAFCRIEAAPLDNNRMEQALKLIIRGRKNALFFKTPAGAAIADVITSVVATAYQAGINAFPSSVMPRRSSASQSSGYRGIIRTTIEAKKKVA